MKYVNYTDADGYAHRSLVRDDRDDPRQGIPFDPPPLGALDLLETQRLAIWNALAERGLYTWRDVLRQQDGITSALRTLAARSVLPAAQISNIKRQLVMLYRQEATHER